MVEFSSEPYNQTSSDRLQNALNAYLEIIESTDASPADIIVFPEGTLNSQHQGIELPDPSDNIIPCYQDDMHPALINISCSAIRTQKYVVINLTEKKSTAMVDSEEITLYYNSNVVFDREGRVISRYRKFNLFGETGISVPEKPDISYFTTDFNVTFGHFICFDLLFKTPALELPYSVTDIVYPTMWFSELPFLTAVQAQTMWSRKMGFNFLAAGASNPSVGSSGSSIISKLGPIKAIMSGNPLRRLIVAEVPKKEFWEDKEVEDKFSYKPSEIEAENEKMYIKQDALQVYSSKFLDFESRYLFERNETLCYGDLCCDFEIRATKVNFAEYIKSYKHFLVVFDGVRSYDGFATGGTFACALISCIGSELSDCGQRFDPDDHVKEDVRFENLKIVGNFRSTEDTLAMANTVDHQLMPLEDGLYRYEESEQHSG